ncbi:MAG: ABC transporter permease [Propionibacteriaceae bacterium]|jgi:ribose transport system permease protein|nr:ABC transporter permease [Propionibacteriaceae bacterium]
MSQTVVEAPAAAEAAQQNPIKAFLLKIGLVNVSLVAAILVLGTFITIFKPVFLTGQNLVTIGNYVTVMGLLALVQTVVIIMGGIDISVGSTAGLCSVLVGMLYGSAETGTHNPWLAMAVALVVGGVCGLFNGIVVIFGRITPLIATLATLSSYKGIAQLISNGRAQGNTQVDPVFIAIARGSFLGISTLIWILLFVAALIHVMLRYLRIGRDIYAVGGNDMAARLSGINVNNRIMFVFVLAGVVAAIAGIVITARTGSGQPVSGSEGMEMLAVTGAALGGAALRGGKGSVISTILAVILLGVLINGMTLVNINPFWQNIAQGALLIAACVIQMASSGERRVGLPK